MTPEELGTVRAASEASRLSVAESIRAYERSEDSRFNLAL
jgi:hypothetical protein